MAGRITNEIVAANVRWEDVTSINTPARCRCETSIGMVFAAVAEFARRVHCQKARTVVSSDVWLPPSPFRFRRDLRPVNGMLLQTFDGLAVCVEEESPGVVLIEAPLVPVELNLVDLKISADKSKSLAPAAQINPVVDRPEQSAVLMLDTARRINFATAFVNEFFLIGNGWVGKENRLKQGALEMKIEEGMAT